MIEERAVTEDAVFELRDIIWRKMDQQQRPRLITSRLTASVAVIITAYVTGLALRSAFWQSPHHFRWILPLDRLLPPWAVLASNLLLYAAMLCYALLFLSL